MGSAADKLLARMRRTKHGWGPDDLHSLYAGFGFACRQGAKHRVYIHSRYHWLRATASRQGRLPVGYISDAIRTIDEVQRLDAETKRSPGG